ncbi:flowering time control protein FCA-like [Dorcoceras hygrometricum]|uniref:Flowering time control protein FCA-like n=1 Tax=Dorcoceras hygrometricum TaxID=472368 RepID=A0A2Z7AML1_9LAMI|nr:flowering time control protein FCA-like [Dorcoceras hygrometricum]
MDGLQRRPDHITPPPSFAPDGCQHQQLHHDQKFNGEQNPLPGGHPDTSFNNAPPQSCQKRQFSRLSNLISSVFGEHGHIVEIVLLKDKVTGLQQEQAEQAIWALHGQFTFGRGCDQPLVVRFADPKKPRVDSRPTPYPSYPSSGNMMPNEMQQSKSSYAGFKTMTTPSTSCASATLAMAEHSHPVECEWSEHVSPDGDLYYYNCVTCESRWELPEECELYEQEIDKDQQQLQETTYEAQLV